MKHFSTYFKGEEKEIFDATWQYLKDHCDVTPDGVFFVKFHVTDKKQFEEKIRSRMRGYHRDRSSEQIAEDRKNARPPRWLMEQRIKEVGELNAKRKFTLMQKIIRYFK